MVVPAVVAPQGGLYNGQITPRGSSGPLFCVWLWCTPAAILVRGSIKPTGLMGLALPWYAAEPLCWAHLACIPTHLHGAALWGSLGAT